MVNDGKRSCAVPPPFTRRRLSAISAGMPAAPAARARCSVAIFFYRIITPGARSAPEKLRGVCMDPLWNPFIFIANDRSLSGARFEWNDDLKGNDIPEREMVKLIAN